jgi:hypothetical protein
MNSHCLIKENPKPASLCVALYLLLASEVTPGSLAEAEPDAQQFYVTIYLMG